MNKSTRTQRRILFNYHDDAGRVIAQKVRLDLGNGNKTFRVRSPVANPEGYRGIGQPYLEGREDGPRSWWVDRVEEEWVKSLPYRPHRQQKLLDTGNPGVIYFPEGERDVEAILDAGEVATTILQEGREDFYAQWAEFFRGFSGTCLVVIDNDEHGYGAKRGLAVRKALVGVGCKVEVLRPPDGYKDVRDMLEDGKPLSALQAVTVKELRQEAKT